MATSDNSNGHLQNMFRFETTSSVTEETTGTVHGFVNAVTVWINKPHVVNRRLCGTRINYFELLQQHEFDAVDIYHLLYSIGFKLSTKLQICSVKGNDQAEPSIATTGCQQHEGEDEISGLNDLSQGGVTVIVREMLPKQPERHKNMPELIVYKQAEKSFSFYPLVAIGEETECLEVAYKFSYLTESVPRIQLCTDSGDMSCDSRRKLSLTWLQSRLTGKLARWSEEPGLRTALTSLRLVPLADYSRLYSELKNKYGLHFAKVWPEKTDPQKFVFEDVAIATYLLLLWEQDRERKGLTAKQSFVDLGCGNGLLVHILASEGHPGYGIDVRRRNIWDMYGPETILKEEAITPSSESLFPETDWLIGNHSDELTPWIPVMAARSSYDCCYFVLPCCHYDFNCKFRHNGLGGSVDGQYRTYLNFVASVGDTCGFSVEEDVLRIPSTKRVCFVGRNRTYQAEAEEDIDKLRHEFICSRCEKPVTTTSTDPHMNGRDGEIGSDNSKWVSDFTPRNKVEVTRNCVSISTETKETVIKTVFQNILAAESCDTRPGHDGKPWRRGGSIAVGDVVRLFEKDLLQELKSECGGLQTLLRNSSHIFQVSSGQVKLRDFTQDDPFAGRKRKTGDRSDFVKTAMCWFHVHHPDGCPRAADKCLYAHGVAELRERPKKVQTLARAPDEVLNPFTPE